jgi:uncharacterized damage-inducible protein DinB
MTRSPVEDAFAHHGWATLWLLDVCSMLTAEQLKSVVSGGYGSIEATLWHLVDSDADDARLRWVCGWR